jgi:very-short-patch-repair endonuclease/cellulose biosynthesis protein BcsQ
MEARELAEFEAILKIAKDRVQRLFKFLEEFNKHRNPARTRIEEYEWHYFLHDLPADPHILTFFDKYDTADETYDIVTPTVLDIERPRLCECTTPPEALEDWVLDGWEDPRKEAGVQASKIDESGQEEKFASSPTRVAALQEWQRKRETWRKSEIPARDAMQLYESFYYWYSTFKREPDKYEVLLADGILKWRTAGVGAIEHPLLLKRVELVFDPETPSFSLVETDRPVEFYAGLFSQVEEAEGHTIAERGRAVSEGYIHPLEATKTGLFLRQTATSLSSQSARGVYVDDIDAVTAGDFPQVGRKPLLLIRQRTFGFASAIDAIIRHLDDRESIPRSFYGVVGLADDLERTSEGDAVIGDEEILLGKPANEEQFRIVRDLERHENVLVQGPPGTGKSHTIANIIGHLLSRGKRVLVTSQNSKALRVLRDLIAPAIQPLAISVFNDEGTATRELETAVSDIVEKLTGSSVSQLAQEEMELSTRRKELLGRKEQLRGQLIRAVQGEYAEIVIDGVPNTPAEAARKVVDGIGADDWMPRAIDARATLPLPREEIVRLYATNGDCTAADEEMLSHGVPDIREFFTPARFEELVNQYRDAQARYRGEYAAYWRGQSAGNEQIDALIDEAERALFPLELQTEWEVGALYAGMQGGMARKPWDDLLDQIASFKETSERYGYVEFKCRPQLDASCDLGFLRTALTEIIAALKPDETLSWLQRTTHPGWKKAIESCLVKDGRPKKREDFEDLQELVAYRIGQQEFARALDILFLNEMPVALSAAREDVVYQLQRLAERVGACLSWHCSLWSELISHAISAGLEWERFAATYRSAQGASRKEYLVACRLTLTDLTTKVLPEKKLQLELDALKQELGGFSGKIAELVAAGKNRLVFEAMEAAQKLDPARYARAYETLVALLTKRDQYEKRRELLARLEKSNPAWAKAISRREKPHDESEPPGDPYRAWLWNRMEFELREMNAAGYNEIQEQLQHVNDQIIQVTNNLIKTRAWKNQIANTLPSQRSALVGYAAIAKRMGRGKVKGYARLLREAKENLKTGSSAVPVWIMPLVKVAESFNPASTRFDVLIVDEASQCDLMAFIAMYMAERVIIVGDDEQVTPSAVGQKLDLVHKLIDQYLYGIPNGVTFDGRKSIYEIAEASFGAAICLREHFRCVPEIIQFSNRLSYGGKILPLRESGSTHLKPAVVPYRVPNAFHSGKVNPAEALVVASLVAACTRMEEYRDKSIGVITLLGDEQALVIDRQIRNWVTEDVCARYDIICGNPYHLQGDERDVVFLSMVHGPLDDPPYPLNDGEGHEGMFKKRYNVAASRAKDQMWVVHSMSSSDLKPGDIRRHLLDYAYDPAAWEINREDLEKRTQSPFEADVLNGLFNRGYDVVPQWRVGAYAIDIVARSAGRRVAIECDGEKYHTAVNLVADFERQAILERLGWKFIRIRGSEFYRDKQGTINRVEEKLRRLRIEPGQAGAGPISSEQPELIGKVIRLAEWLRSSEAETQPSTKEPDGFETAPEGEPGGRRAQTAARDISEEINGNRNADVPRNGEPAADRDSTVTQIIRPRAGEKEKHASNRRKHVGPRKEEAAAEADRRDVADVAAKGKDFWFALSHWGKETDRLNSIERGFAYQVGKLVARKLPLTSKQLAWAREIMRTAEEAGFMP